MVALAGPGWRLAPSLVLYVEEVDRRFPIRDRRSDGSIGDAAHASRDSDHNPRDGWVHAVDLDEDVAPGVDLEAMWAMAIKLKDPRDRYLIYEGQIVKSYVDGLGHRAWDPYPYTGPNPHDGHLHRSINRTAAARNDLRPWGLDAAFPRTRPKPRQQEDDMRRIIKGDGKGVDEVEAAKWWVTDGITRRHVNDRAEAAQLAYLGLAEWDNGEPFPVPQSLVNDLVLA